MRYYNVFYQMNFICKTMHLLPYIAIYSDSQAALKALSAAKVTSGLVADTITALKRTGGFQQRTAGRGSGTQRYIRQ